MWEPGRSISRFLTQAAVGPEFYVIGSLPAGAMLARFRGWFHATATGRHILYLGLSPSSEASAASLRSSQSLVTGWEVPAGITPLGIPGIDIQGTNLRDQSFDFAVGIVAGGGSQFVHAAIHAVTGAVGFWFLSCDILVRGSSPGENGTVTAGA